MDGLEATEVSFGNLQYVIDYRIEAEYFNKRFIQNEKLLNSCCCKSFNEEAKAINGRPYSSERFTSVGDVFVSKIGDVTNKKDSQTWEMVDQQEFDCNKGDYLNDFDILMTLTGDPPDVGKTNMVLTNGSNCTWNQRVANICRKSNYYISNFVLYAVLSTDICRMQMERYAKGIRQRNLGNDCFNFIKIPKLGSDLQKIIDLSVKEHINSLKLSNDCYNNAKKEIEQIIALSNYKIKENTSRKNLSESFLKTGRLDAEYYQPKYDVLFDILKEFDCEPLGGSSGICNIKKSIEPGSEAYQEEGIPFIRVSDIDKYGIAQPEIHLSADIVENVDELYPQKDTILLSKDGSVGVSYKVREDMKAITSGALLHLTVKDKSKVLPDYLTLVLNSSVVQLQAERDTNGAIIQHWKPSEIEKVLIPILDMDIQKDIASKVKESFALRKKSKELLEYAKQAVEMAIEQGEDAALELLKDKVN